MRFTEHLVVIRGGGDLASGVGHQLHQAGFPVAVLELARPRAIRRTVSFATAVTEGSVTIDALEPVTGRMVAGPQPALDVVAAGEVAVLVAPELPSFEPPAAVVVDARMAKRNLDTTIADAPLVVALGPGFTAGVDCHAVVETMRGHRLGRVYWNGPAEPDTGIPGAIGGASAERVVRAPATGAVTWSVHIGDRVAAGDPLGKVADEEVRAPVAGVVRGLIASGFPGESGLKIADIDPRGDSAACFEISDKARLVGAGVLQAVLSWLGRPL